MAKHNKFKKTLFFIASNKATADEIEASMEFEPGVQFRNVSLTRPDEAIEAFDRLAGAIPARYQAIADKRAGKVPDASETPPDGAPAAIPAANGTDGPVVVKAPTPNTGAGWARNS